MSKALEILSANLESLIGEGKRFRNDNEMGEKTGLGQRQIHRLRTMATVPKFGNLDILSEKLHISVAALLSPGMNVLEGTLPPEVADLVQRICTLAFKRALEPHDLMHLSSAVSLIEKSKGNVILSSEGNKRGTGT